MQHLRIRPVTASSQNGLCKRVCGSRLVGCRYLPRLLSFSPHVAREHTSVGPEFLDYAV